MNVQATQEELTSQEVAPNAKDKLDQIFLRAINRTNENLRKSQELSSLVEKTLPPATNVKYDNNYLGKDWRINNNTYFDGTGTLRSDQNKIFNDTDREVAKLREDMNNEIIGAEKAKQNLLNLLDESQGTIKKEDL